MKTSMALILSLFAGVLAVARGETGEYSDQDIKRQIVFAGRCYHAEDMDSNYEWSFRMAGCDTNRYARVLCELAGENTNQTRRAIALLGVYKTPQSLPFLYAYATNAEYVAYAMKAIFDIEGVTSSSFSVMGDYLSVTNALTNGQSHDCSVLCKDLLNRIYSSPELAAFRQDCLDMMIDFAKYRNFGHVSLDDSIQSADPTYHASKRRLDVLRAAQNRCGNSFQLDYVTNAINELVAYPEANLPD